MKKAKVLLIDDDQQLSELLVEYLNSEGFEVTCCFDGVTGLAKAFDDSIDIILLDVMMPNLNGFEVLKALGGSHKTPILMLTAKGDEDDKVKGLELGADDYLAKPFHHKELVARINAILRRINKLNENTPTKTSSLCVNNVELNDASRAVLCHNQPVELTGTEYQMLALLMNQNGKIVSKAQLSEQVLNRKLSPFDRNIDMHISNIRKKLLASHNEEKLKTIRGAGYIFLTGE